MQEVLARIRQGLVELRFEDAASTAGALLARTDLSEDERVEALRLRCQAWIAAGRLDAAEQDFRAILSIRPSYRPDPALIPPKAMARFERARAAVVGTLALSLDPEDAALQIDGKPAQLSPEGVPLVAGTHVIRAAHRGFDPDERTVEIAAGKEAPLEIRLTPNARQVILHTEPAGVDVLVDGAPAGRTESPAGGAEGTGELALQDVPPGEHTFELRKPCWLTERRDEMIAVDLLDRTPTVLSWKMQPASSRVTLTGAPEWSEALVDGEPAPLTAGVLEACAGRRVLEIHRGGRTIWRLETEIPEQEGVSLDVQPRPNAVLVGLGAWPDALSGMRDQVSTLPMVAAPPGFDAGSPGSWTQLSLPADTDLAIAPAPPGGEGGFDLYSPHLRTVERLTAAPTLERPSWIEGTSGMRVADSPIAGSARVLDVRAGGPAATGRIVAGDRILVIAGQNVAGAAEVERAIRQAPDGRLEILVASPGGEQRMVALRPGSGPVLLPPPAGSSAAIRAAWAALDAAAWPERSAAALANLALLQSRAGRHDAALETWRAVRFGARQGIGEGTVAYHSGCELEDLGRESEALVAFREALASSSTDLRDDGPPVAPAAADHLADHGVAVEASPAGAPVSAP